MSEEQAQDTAPVADAQPQDGLSADALRKEVEALRKEAAKYRTKAKSLEDSKAQEAEEAAKKRGEFEQLYAKEKADREALAAKVSAYEAAQEAELAEIVKGLDDDSKEIIEALQPDKRLTMARKLAGKKAAPLGTTSTAGGRGTNSKFGGYGSEEEWAKANYAEYKKWRDGGRKP